MEPLLIELATPFRGRPPETQSYYHEEVAMTRLLDGRLAIDAPSEQPTSKKCDVEKGEDQKDRW